jgi:endonuclease YncB( thermonuclease family)
MWILAAVAIALLAVPTFAQDIRVIDGDTFEMDGEVIQLWGIDAPELDQTCEHESRTLEGIGRLSRGFLEVLLQRSVTCDRMDTDRFGRTVARCFIPDNADIGEVMVVLGYAWDHPENSDGFYAEYEASARDNERGIWTGECAPAWEWRRQSER